MIIRYLGHSAFHIQTKGANVLIDPYISPNPKASHINIDDLQADCILVTHGHGDHVADVSSIALRTRAEVISNYEVATWFGNQGINGYGMNHGGKVDRPWATIKYVNAIHSSTLPDGSSGGNPGGFVLWNDEACIYIAGDTALTLDMQLIPRTCPPLDLAILPIGDNFTMGYDEAVIASDFIKCNKVIGCHYDTFPPIEIDNQKAAQAFRDAGKELVLLEIGASMSV